jgi:subtilisin family serine protease
LQNPEVYIKLRRSCRISLLVALSLADVQTSLAGVRPSRAYEPARVAADRIVLRLASSDGAADLARARSDGTFASGNAALDVALHEVRATSAALLFPHPRFALHDVARPEALDRYVRVRIALGMDAHAAVQRLAATPGVESAELVPVVPVTVVPNDWYYASQWALSATDGHGVNAQPAWDVTFGDSSVVLAICDTGVDWTHPDLAGAIWRNEAEAKGLPGADDDGDGYIDDVRGWDFVDSVNVWPGEDGAVADNDPSDFNGHGTHLAGIVSALTNNIVGIASLAGGCRIMALRMGYSARDVFSGNEAAYVDMDFAAQAFVYAADHGATAINCSWGSTSFSAFQTAVDYAAAAGVAVVDAAGNNGDESQVGNYLSTRGDCFDVAAVDSLDRRVAFSSYGAWVDLSAPGYDILSTYYDHNAQTHGYAWLSGTSQAAPFVTALIGLYTSAHPTATLEQIRRRLQATAASVDAYNDPEFAGLLGWGRIDAGEALSPSRSIWQTSLGESVRTSIAVGDLSANDRGVTVLTTTEGTVHALGAGGVSVQGWPVALRSTPRLTLEPPAIGTVRGAPAVVVGGDDGLLRVLDGSGVALPGWPRRLDAPIRGAASCASIRPGPATTIVACTEAGSVYALDSAGDALPGWPRQAGGAVRAPAALADINGDGVRDVIVGAENGCLYAWEGDGSSLQGWPTCGGFGTSPFTQPAVAGALGGAGGESVACITDEGRVYVFNRFGLLQPGWPVRLNGGAPSPIALANMDADTLAEIVVATGQTLNALHADGTFVEGWPVTLPAPVVGSPLVADLTGAGESDVLVAATDGRLYAFAPNGAPLAGWPRTTGGAIEGGPTIGDAGADGTPDVVAASDDGWAYSWVIPGAPRTPDLLPWPAYAHDAAHTGQLTPRGETAARGEQDASSIAGHFAVRPIGSATGGAQRLAVDIPTQTGGQASPLRLTLVDVAGRVSATMDFPVPSGRSRVSWRLIGANGRSVPEGVYIFHAAWRDQALVRRLIVLR